ncbi:MAG TPA: murein biosynthesis integral membrane protein MurJ [Vicinamibacteria bacterium]|nr:murein biosynthesis integral membrane protein MurJ [Vicinamibacteria bacterium]
MSDLVKDAQGAARPGGSLMRSAGRISALTLLSRILGLVREQVFAALLGAGFYADAFLAAFRIPNLLRDLFAEGALSAAFVPTYARALSEGGPRRGVELSGRLLTLLGVILTALTLLGLAFAGPLVALIAPGFAQEPGKAELTVRLTRIMLPFLPVVSFAAVAMGMLNAHGRYGPPAAASSMFNVVSIAWAVMLWAAGFGTAEVVVGWAVGTLLGGLAQLLIQVPPLWRAGWRPRLEWAPGDPGLRAIARLMGPATVGLAAVEINILASTFFASHEDGAIAWLQYAFRILYLPIGVFGVAVGTVAATGLAWRAAQGDLDGLRDTLGHSLRTLAFMTFPATAGLMTLAVPIVRLLFERGAFAPADTANTAAALVLYATGLVAYTGVKVLAPAFYALGTPRVPLLASVTAVITNLALIAVLYPRMGFRAIALGTAMGSIANVLVLVGVFEARRGGLVRLVATWPVARMAAAAALMAGAASFASRTLESALGTRGLAANLVTGLAPVAIGAVLYLGLALALRIPEARDLLAALRRGRPA